MAINRTVFNASVDDSGSGTDGTIEDKAWFTAAILDPIDAALATPQIGPTPYANLVLIDSFQPAEARVFRIMDGSQLLQFDALNDALTVSVASPLQLTRTGDAKVGRDVYEKGRTTPMGHWQTVPFNAANFSATGGATWTVTAGNQSVYSYCLLGKTLHIVLYLTSTTLSAAASTVQIALPVGGMSSLSVGGVVAYKNPGAGYGVLFATPGTVMQFYRDLSGTGWTAGALDLLGQFTLQIA